MTKFYLYSQNNSYGWWVSNPKLGLGKNVFIEANSDSEADEIALSKGIYFNGSNDLIDCPCCGDRWYEVDSWSIYNSYDIVKTYLEQPYLMQPENIKNYIHRLDGTVEEC